MEIRHIETKLSRATTLPILPNAVAQVLALTDNPNAGARDYERVIKQDAALTTKILRTANSPYYGCGNITNLQRALSQLGVNAIRSICLAVSFQSALASRGLDRRFSPARFWQHCLAVACGAKVLACVAHDPNAEEAFIAGLVHDIGKLALCMFLPLETNQVYNIMAEQKISQYQAELQLLGVTHQEVGRIAAERWGMPPIYANPISKHHNPSDMEEMDNLTAYVHVSNVLAHEMGLHSGDDTICPEMDEMAAMRVGLSPEQLEPIRLAVAKEVARISSVMGLA